MMDLSGYFAALRDRHAAHIAREAEKLAEREAVMDAIAAENAFKQMSSEAAKLGITLANTGGVITASITDPTGAAATAIQGLIDKFPGLNTAIDHTNDVMVNGETVTAGAQAGFIKLGDDIAKAAESYTPFVGVVSDGTTKIGNMTISTNASAVALDAEGKAAVKAADGVQAHTAATVAADKAAQALAQHQETMTMTTGQIKIAQFA